MSIDDLREINYDDIDLIKNIYLVLEVIYGIDINWIKNLINYVKILKLDLERKISSVEGKTLLFCPGNSPMIVSFLLELLYPDFFNENLVLFNLSLSGIQEKEKEYYTDKINDYFKKYLSKMFVKKNINLGDFSNVIILDYSTTGSTIEFLNKLLNEMISSINIINQDMKIIDLIYKLKFYMDIDKNRDILMKEHNLTNENILEYLNKDIEEIKGDLDAEYDYYNDYETSPEEKIETKKEIKKLEILQKLKIAQIDESESESEIELYNKIDFSLNELIENYHKIITNVLVVQKFNYPELRCLFSFKLEKREGKPSIKEFLESEQTLNEYLDSFDELKYEIILCNILKYIIILYMNNKELLNKIYDENKIILSSLEN